MKHKHLVLTAIALVLFMAFIGCKKEQQEPLTPKITNEKVETTATTATFTWTVEWVGNRVSVVELSENEDMSHSQFYGSEEETENHNFTVTVTGVNDGTKYYYKYLVWNKYYVDNKFQMEVKSFTTVALHKPTVTTASVSQLNFTNATAIGGGDVTSDGNDAVTERGIYFSTSHDPATTGAKIKASSAGTGSFTCTLTGLVEGTTYYICAYATNGQGRSYGSETVFSFNPPPTGAINGIFSVSSSKKVYFSQGNLQYRASTNTWRFAEHQYDRIGNNNSNISQSYSGWIDLFGWGTSGWNSGAECYQPWSTSQTNSDYYIGSNCSNNLTGLFANADWGVYNAIYHGGDQAGLWRTMTKEEWSYVFRNRIDASLKYGQGKVNDVFGMILLPDNWTLPAGLNFTAGNGSWLNHYTMEQWALMEANGAVFLPVAGYRQGTSVILVDTLGTYWSASQFGGNYVCGIHFSDDVLNPQDCENRCNGRSVRLVCPAEN